MTGFLSVANGVFLFLLTKIVPAAFRVTVAVVVWLFTFVQSHHAAILAALGWFGTQVLSANSWALTAAKVAFAYFGTSAFTGLLNELKTGGEGVLVDLREVVAGEWSRLELGFYSLFPHKPPVLPPVPEPAPVKPAPIPEPVSVPIGSGGKVAVGFTQDGKPVETEDEPTGTITPAPNYVITEPDGLQG